MEYHAINDYIIVKMVVKENSQGGIAIPDMEKYVQTGKVDIDFFADQIGDLVTKVHTGDKLIIAQFTVNNVNYLLNQLNSKAPVGTKYFLVQEKDVIGIIVSSVSSSTRPSTSSSTIEYNPSKVDKEKEKKVKDTKKK